jgi:hypothetical protein
MAIYQIIEIVYLVKKTDEKSSANKVNNAIRQHGNHDIDKQIKLFKNIYNNKKSIIKIDPAMKRILDIKD